MVLPETVQELCITDKQYSKKIFQKRGKGPMNCGLSQLFEAGFSFGPKSL